MATVQEKAFQDFIGMQEFDGEKYVKYEKYQETLKKYQNRGYEIDELKEKIYEMDQHIKCLKSDLEEVQSNRFELPKEPIKVAEMMIDATETRENCMTGKEYDKPVYEKWQLEQIARHLLVHCAKREE